MDKRQIRLALALKELNATHDVRSFHSRLILQKTVYLIQAAGIRLGYSFNWYLRGPYSPGLTRDVYELDFSGDDLTNEWALDEGSKASARKIRPLLDATAKKDAASRASQLELFASLHYLAGRGRVDLNNPEVARKELAANGKQFTVQQIAEAAEELRQVELA